MDNPLYLYTDPYSVNLEHNTGFTSDVHALLTPPFNTITWITNILGITSDQEYAA